MDNNNYNKDELEIPEWLTKKFLEDVLKQSENNNNVKVNDFNVGPATAKGDHFASIMFRIAVEFLVSNIPKHMSLILKTLPVKDGFKKNLVGNSYAFETEIKMYNEIIPKFHKILRDTGDETILGARMIYSSLDPIKIIIFEDLKTQGYQILPNKYLEPDEVDALLKKICRWHAISFKLLKEGDKSVQEFRNSGFDLEEVKSFFHRSINGFLKLLYDQNFDPIYIEKFEKIKEVIVEECRDIYSLKGDLCVLNHGDFTLKNIMVKIGQKDTIDDLMLVDFQFCVAAPLVSDLTYLLYAILNPHSRDQHDKIIYKYHTLFIEILKKLEYKGKIPTLIDIRTEMMRFKALEVALIMVFMPFMCAVKDKVEIDDRLMEDPNFFLSFYERPVYISTIQKILPELLHKGYLD